MSQPSIGLGSTGRRLLRLPAVMAKLSVSRTTIWRMVAAGLLPPPFAVSERAMAWWEDEIDHALEARAAKRAMVDAD